MSKEINNNIEEPLCGYEICKLLKNKGFEGGTQWKHEVFVDGKEAPFVAHWHSGCEEVLLRPSHTLAIEWIRVNFKVNILLNITQSVLEFSYFCIILHPIKGWNTTKNFKTPQEACEAALLHTLKELI